MSVLLPSNLIKRIRVYRYVVYASLILGGFWHAHLTYTDVSALLSLLVLIPGLLHCLDARWPEGVQGVEAVVVPLLLFFAGLPNDYLLAFSVLALMASIALWGFASKSVWSAAAVLVAMVIYGVPISEYQATQLFWGVGLVALVHVQANVHLDGHERLKRRQNDILKFLPESFDPKTHRRHQRQWLTVAFVDLGGFTPAVETLAPEVTREILNGFLGEVTRQISCNGGSVGKFLGDGVLCTFAASDASERVRAARSCMETMRRLVHWLPDFNAASHERGCYLDFSLSIGIASGYCSVGDWGRGERLDFTVIGGPVNLAYRLQEAVCELEPLVPILMDRTTRTLLGDAGPQRTFELTLKGLDRQDVFSPT